jgi:hypothetical protein
MYMLYTDDSILTGPDLEELFKQSGLEITTEDEGIDDFLGVNIKAKNDGSFILIQPHLIKSILNDLSLNKLNISTKDTPMATSKILSQHPNSPPFDEHFHYQ